jgi:hypothetical protein
LSKVNETGDVQSLNTFGLAFSVNSAFTVSATETASASSSTSITATGATSHATNDAKGAMIVANTPLIGTYTDRACDGAFINSGTFPVTVGAACSLQVTGIQNSPNNVVTGSDTLTCGRREIHIAVSGDIQSVGAGLVEYDLSIQVVGGAGSCTSACEASTLTPFGPRPRGRDLRGGDSLLFSRPRIGTLL